MQTNDALYASDRAFYSYVTTSAFTKRARQNSTATIATLTAVVVVGSYLEKPPLNAVADKPKLEVPDPETVDQIDATVEEIKQISTGAELIRTCTGNQKVQAL